MGFPSKESPRERNPMSRRSENPDPNSPPEKKKNTKKTRRENFFRRTRRLIKIVQLCQTVQPRLADLAELCEVHPRTIARDIKDLAKIGVVVSYDPDTRQLKIPVQHSIPLQQRLQREEAFAILTLCLEGLKNPRYPFMEAALEGVRKILSTFPFETAQHLRKRAGIAFMKKEPMHPHLQSREFFENLQKAMVRKKKVRIRYRGALDKEEIGTLLEPYQLLFVRRAWYVIARSSLFQETRTFHLGRIQKLEITDEDYRIPKGFSIQRYLGNAWCLIREPGPDSEVVVRFSPLVAQNVSEVHWHHTQRTTPNPADGSLLFHARVSGTNEILWWILGYGKEAEVLQPRELREKITMHVQEMVKMYITGEKSALDPSNVPPPGMKHPLDRR